MDSENNKKNPVDKSIFENFFEGAAKNRGITSDMVMIEMLADMQEAASREVAKDKQEN